MCALESKNLDLCYSFVWAWALASETVRRSSRALGVDASGRRPPRPDGDDVWCDWRQSGGKL